MPLEFSENFWKIISRFLGKTPINARFVSFFTTCLLFTFHNSFSILSYNRFQNFFKFFLNFICFLLNFTAVCSFSGVNYLFLPQIASCFLRSFSKVTLKSMRKIHKVFIKIFGKCLQGVPNIFSIIFVSCYFLNFLK